MVALLPFDDLDLLGHELVVELVNLGVEELLLDGERSLLLGVDIVLGGEVSDSSVFGV